MLYQKTLSLKTSLALCGPIHVKYQRIFMLLFSATFNTIYIRALAIAKNFYNRA